MRRKRLYKNSSRLISGWRYWRCSSKQLALEQINQLDDQDYDDGELEEERPALVELVDHEAIQFLSRAHLAGDQVLVVGHADLERGQPVKTSGKHVAQKLDGVVGVLGELRHIEQHRMQPRCRPGQPPSREDAGPFVEQLV